MRKCKLHCAIAALATIPLFSLATRSASAAAIVTASPAPYLSTANSTLNPLSPTYFVEDFEDGALNIPASALPRWADRSSMDCRWMPMTGRSTGQGGTEKASAVPLRRE